MTYPSWNQPFFVFEIDVWRNSTESMRNTWGPPKANVSWELVPANPSINGHLPETLLDNCGLDHSQMEWIWIERRSGLTRYGSCSNSFHVSLEGDACEACSSSSCSFCNMPGLAMRWYEITERVCATVIVLEWR